jgi:hypothetical protein
MAITVPPLDNPSNEVPPEAESSTDAPGVGSSSGNPQRDLSAQVNDCITQAKRYLTMCLLFLLSNPSLLSLKILIQSRGGCNQAVYQDLLGDLRHEPTRCGMLICYSNKHSDFMKASFVYRLLSRLLRSSLSFLCWLSCESGAFTM